MGISFSQYVLLSKTKKPNPLIKVTDYMKILFYFLRQITLLLKDTD